jgi:flagellar biosynthetic protein FliP
MASTVLVHATPVFEAQPELGARKAWLPSPPAVRWMVTVFALLALVFLEALMGSGSAWAQSGGGNASAAVTSAATSATATATAASPSAPSGGRLPLLIGQGAGGTSYSVPIQTLLFFTALSFIPAVVLLMTSFTRIVIVLSLLRQAIGTQAAPPNQVIIGLSLFLTFFVMGPTIDRVYAEAYQPYAESRIDFPEALNRAEVPMREFMLRQTRQSDVALFARLARIDKDVPSAQVPFKVLVPAFVTSELKSAFQIGFLIFIPFLVIDLIVASVLMSLGMMMLSPVLVSLPFKLMLFVLADGWNLLLGSLAASFNT